MTTSKNTKQNNKKPSPELIARGEEILEILEKLYPDSDCTLEYKDEPWKLMVMARLSAQCKDSRVNVVSEMLFSEYKTPEELSRADIADIERIVKPCGLYRMKAKDIKNECLMLVRDYGGVLPDDIDTLLKFPGVGRKIANLLVSDIYGKDAIVADTHCIRISGRLGLTPDKTKNPYLVEMTLREIIRPGKGAAFCHRLVDFGRQRCRAVSPLCDACPLKELCPDKGMG